MTRNHRMAAAMAVTLAVFIKLYCNNSTSPAAGPAEVVTLSISDQEKYGMLTPKLGVGEPMYVVGDNSCYMTIGYMDDSTLSSILPASMTMLPDETIRKTFPMEREIPNNKYPFMISFCRGKNIHDVHTEFNVPEQEEIMVVIPVLYKDQKSGTSNICSFIPVLYLDSLVGVVGGLFFGLRKEYHPSSSNMLGGWFKTATRPEGGKSWHVKDVIRASLSRKKNATTIEMPQFIAKLFELPFVTISYFGTHIAYKAAVHPTIVQPAELSLEHDYLSWTYKGATISTTDTTTSVFANYNFAMSRSVRAHKMLMTE